MRLIALLAFVSTMIALSVAPAEARRRCDGFNGCRCGTTQARHYGLPYVYRGHNLKRAVEWKRAFPRTTARAGAVVYQTGGGPSGHVSRIVRVVSRCTAVVSDDKGTYRRNICKRNAVYVDPSRGAVRSAKRSVKRHYAQRRTKRHYAQRRGQRATHRVASVASKPSSVIW